MTAPQPPDLSLDALRHLAAVAGLSLTEARLVELRPVVETNLRNYARLRSPELRDVEPAVTAAPLVDAAAVNEP